MSKAIVLQIKNNTQAKQRLRLMAPYSLNDNANAKTEYRYDFTGVTLNGSAVVLQVKPVGAAAFQEVFADAPAQSIQGVVDALNTVGLGGSWYSYVENGRTYIAIYSDSYQFGTVDYRTAGAGTLSFVVHPWAYPFTQQVQVETVPNYSGDIVWGDGVVEVAGALASTYDATHNYNAGGSYTMQLALAPNQLRGLLITNCESLTMSELAPYTQLARLELIDSRATQLPPLLFFPLNTFRFTGSQLFSQFDGELPDQLETLVVTGTSLTALPNYPAGLASIDISSNYFGELGLETMLGNLVNNGLTGGYLKIGYQQGEPVTLNSNADNYATTLMSRGWTIVFTP